MPRRPRFLRRLTALFTWSARDEDMQQEMAFHIESAKRDYLRSGMSEADAEAAARRRFGSVLRLKEQGHDVRSSRLLEDLLRDVRHMSRGLRRSPGFTVAVVLTLALGIGGNTAIFSVVDQVLLRPLPYAEGDQLIVIREAGLNQKTHDTSPANWLDWQRESRTTTGMAAWSSVSGTMTGVGDPARLNGQLVSHEFFPLLGVRPLLGRTLTPEDDRPNAPSVIVISHRLWEQRFGSDPKTVGRIIQLNGRDATIVGVMPPTFRFVYQDNDVWGAYRLDRNQPWRTDGNGRFIQTVVGRLRPEATLEAATTELQGLAQRLAATYEFNRNSTVNVVSLRQEITGQVRSSLVFLYAAVAVLLGIACFNVANLLLARAASRRRDVAIRTSLGAGRAAIVRQLLVESLLLALAGGVLGIGLARWSLDALLAFAPANLLRVPQLFVDRRVLVYALGLSMATGLLVGLIPALLVARRSIVESMRASGTNVTQAPRVRQALVVCQVAMTVILLCGAGLFIRTLIALNATDSGFDRRDLLSMSVAVSPVRYTPPQRLAFYGDLIAALRALPGVESAAVANSLPVIGSIRGGSSFHRLGTPEVPRSQRPSTLIRIAGPGYFHTMRVPILRGREFTEADMASPQQGFVVNEIFARTFLKDIDPLTASLAIRMQDENPYLPVIGVVGNMGEGTLRDGARPTVYYSHRQMPDNFMTLVIRTSQPAAAAAAAVREIKRLDPNVPVTKVETVESAFGESVARERLNALVSGAFAVSGLLLASLGVYGLLAFLVAERTKEIGIRITLGAQLGRLMRSVIGGGLRLVGLGAAIGVVGSLLLLRPIGALLFGVTPNDALTYVTVVAVLGAVATLASYVPARRAAHIEPLVALRED